MATRLYTWLDVESVVERKRYAGQWPKQVRFHVYSEALVVSLNTGGDHQQSKELEQQAINKLSEWFGNYYDQETGTIVLESLSTEKRRVLPVIFESDFDVSDEVDQMSALRPMFMRIALYPEAQEELSQVVKQRVVLPPCPDDWPPIFAFYSFKGGVGRTTHLLAFAKAFSKLYRKKKLLIIDADLEAPGLTWWMRALSKETQISFLDFLALAQYDETDGWQETIELVANRLRKQTPIKIETENGRSEHYFLPAFRDFVQALEMPVQPRHFVQVPDREWRLSEVIMRLGKELGVEGVLIDLRTGFSEISGPLLFDPRVQRILVTSSSSQSVEGTRYVLSLIRKTSLILDEQNDGFNHPKVVISMIPQQKPNLEMIEAQLFAAYADVKEDDVAHMTPPFNVLETDFVDALFHLDGFDSAFSRLGGTSVEKAMTELVKEWLNEKQENESQWATDANVNQALRRRLKDFAAKMVHAENGEGEKFLRTMAIEELGRQFQDVPPVAVVMGAKGSGKTYMFLQMIRRRTWDQFLKELGINGEQMSEATLSGLLYPFLGPGNLSPQTLAWLTSEREKIVRRFGTDQVMSFKEIRDEIQRQLEKEQAGVAEWRNFWFRLIGQSLGFTLETEHPERELIERLRQMRFPLVIVIDGLEDLFQYISSSRAEQTALRALIQDIPNALRELPERWLGLVVFVRKDLARAAIPQNFGQFEDLHKAYELKWNIDEALRLAAWVCREAGVVLDLPDDVPLEEASREALKQAMENVWGYKLGRMKSREARSVRWIFGALVDFKGRIQARDIVRFLEHAAKSALEEPEYDGRLLQPNAVKRAIKPCSEKKIEEVQEEIPWAKALFQQLRDIDFEKRVIPFKAVDLDLSPEDVHLLKEEGILTESEGVLYMPEIYRLGLEFRFAKAGRPKLLSLMNRVLGAI